MSANALIVCVLLGLTVAAAALRLAAGPAPPLKNGETLYTMAKAGWPPTLRADEVELASDAPRPEN